MIIKGIIDEDFVNYKKPSMVIEMPNCDFKCDKECGRKICQNSNLAKAEDIDIPAQEIIERYMKNDITQAIVFQGLEPFDSLKDLIYFITAFRTQSNDDVVIYTGYTEDELESYIKMFRRLFKNIIIKFGRFIPNQPHHTDFILEVELASPNQYAVKIS